MATHHPLCPVKRKPKTEEVSEEEVDHVVTLKTMQKMAHQMAKVEKKDTDDPHDDVLGLSIPSTGRGNSEDGSEWLNPSANQLFRALARKDKAIEYDDAMPVAQVHAVVTEQTWQQILEYEALYWKKCKAPKLARFEGLDGIYSVKAKINHYILGNPWPYDRHDWWVDRCGEEIRYIIDYHAIPNGTFDEDGEENCDYTIDARPAPTIKGMWDRLRMATLRWRKGLPVW